MSAKVRRTPLFGVDGHLGIPLVVSSHQKNIILQVIIFIQIDIIKFMLECKTISVICRIYETD